MAKWASLCADHCRPGVIGLKSLGSRLGSPLDAAEPEDAEAMGGRSLDHRGEQIRAVLVVEFGHAGQAGGDADADPVVDDDVTAPEHAAIAGIAVGEVEGVSVQHVDAEPLPVQRSGHDA